jgi:hypothetical protein
MELEFNRIKCGIYFDEKLKPYSKNFMIQCLEYFKNEEKYQECAILNDIIKNRFNHDNASNFRNTQ